LALTTTAILTVAPKAATVIGTGIVIVADPAGRVAGRGICPAFPGKAVNAPVVGEIVPTTKPFKQFVVTGVAAVAAVQAWVPVKLYWKLPVVMVAWPNMVQGSDKSNTVAKGLTRLIWFFLLFGR
jgi:hypothetical protein